MPEQRTPLNPGSQHASPARTSRIRAKAMTYNLSEIIKLTPNCFDGVKIALVDKAIGEIDLVPRRYQEAKTLFLSNNSIKDLAGISQFPNIQALSLAYNKISDYDTLDYLSICKNLQSLSLDGNPVTKLPFYKSRIIQLLSNLNTLDRQSITNQERAAAQKHADYDSRLMGMLLFCEYNSLSLARCIQVIFNNEELNNIIGMVKKKKILEATIELAKMPQEIDSKDWVTEMSSKLRSKVGAAMDLGTPYQKSIVVLLKYYINAYVKCIKDGLLKNTDMLMELCEKTDFETKKQCINEISSLIGKLKVLEPSSILESNTLDPTTVITTFENLHEELETVKMKVEKGINFNKIIGDMEYVMNNMAEPSDNISKLTTMPPMNGYKGQPQQPQQPQAQQAQQQYSEVPQVDDRNGLGYRNDQSILNVNTLRTADNMNNQLINQQPSMQYNNRSPQGNSVYESGYPPQMMNNDNNVPMQQMDISPSMNTVPIQYTNQPSQMQIQQQQQQQQQNYNNNNNNNLNSRYDMNVSPNYSTAPRERQNIVAENRILSSTVEEYQKVAEANAMKALKLEADFKSRLQSKDDEIAKQEVMLNQIMNKNKDLEETINELKRQLEERNRDYAEVEDNMRRISDEKVDMESVNLELRQKEFELVKLKRNKEAGKIIASVYERYLKEKYLYILKVRHNNSKYENYARQEVYKQRAFSALGYALNVWRRHLYIKKLTELNCAKQENILKKRALVQWVLFTRLSSFVKQSRELAKKNLVKNIFKSWNAELHRRKKNEANEKSINQNRQINLIESKFKQWRALTNSVWISKNNYKNNQRIKMADEFRARRLEIITLRCFSMKLEMVKKSEEILETYLEDKMSRLVSSTFTLMRTVYRYKVQDLDRKFMLAETFGKSRRKNILSATLDKLFLVYDEHKEMERMADEFNRMHELKIMRSVVKTMLDTHNHVLSLATYNAFAHKLYEIRRQSLKYKTFYIWKGLYSEMIERKLENIQIEKDEKKEILKKCIVEWRRYISVQKSVIIYSQSLRLDLAAKEAEASKNTLAEIELARLDTVDKLNALIEEHSEVNIQLKDKVSKINSLESTMKELVVTNNAYKSESTLMKSTIERLKAENSQCRNKLYSLEEAQTAKTASINTELRMKAKEIEDLKTQISDKNMQLERLAKQLELEREGMKMEIETVMQSNERLRERAKQALSYQNSIDNMPSAVDLPPYNVPAPLYKGTTSGINESYTSQNSSYAQQQQQQLSQTTTLRQNDVPYKYQSQNLATQSMPQLNSMMSQSSDNNNNDNNSNSNINDQYTFNNDNLYSSSTSNQLQGIDPAVLQKIGAMESNMNNVILRKNIENSKLRKENEMVRNFILDKIPAVASTNGIVSSGIPSIPKVDTSVSNISPASRRPMSATSSPNTDSIYNGMTNESNGILSNIVKMTEPTINNGTDLAMSNNIDTNNNNNNNNINSPLNSERQQRSSYNSEFGINGDATNINNGSFDNFTLSTIPNQGISSSYYTNQTLRPSQLAMTRPYNKTDSPVTESALKDNNTMPMITANDNMYTSLRQQDTGGDYNVGSVVGMSSIEDEIAALQKKIMSRLE